jgi:hypothetical protein
MQLDILQDARSMVKALTTTLGAIDDELENIEVDNKAGSALEASENIVDHLKELTQAVGTLKKQVAAVQTSIRIQMRKKAKADGVSDED